MNIVGNLEDRIPYYPNFRDPDIQTIITHKKEFGECKSGPEPFKDERVDGIFFNSQVFFARYNFEVNNHVLYYAEASSGKTGSYICYQTLCEIRDRGRFTKFYYTSPRTQIEEFLKQVTVDFAEDKRTESGDINAEIKARRKLAAQRGFICKTTLQLSHEIDSLTNDELIERFSDAHIMLDEAHLVKLDEIKDLSGVKKKSRSVLPEKRDTDIKSNRQRLEIYMSFWRLRRICPACGFTIATGTAATNKPDEVISQINLISDLQIKTPLFEKVVSFVCGSETPKNKRVSIKKVQWYKEKIDFYPENSKPKELERTTRQIEEIVRGSVLFIRAPATGAIEVQEEPLPGLGMAIVNDPKLGKTVTLYYMSEFQAFTYLQAYHRAYKQPKKSKEGENNYLYHPSLQAGVFVFPASEADALLIKKGKMTLKELMSRTKNNRAGLVGTSGFRACTKKFKDTIEKELKSTSYSEKRYGQGHKKEVKVEVRAPFDWFKSYLKDDNCLYQSSSKITNIVEIANNPTTALVCVASNYHYTTCTVIGWALEAREWTEFNPLLGKSWYKVEGNKKTISLPEGKRYAILSSTNEKAHQQILELYYHPDNKLGKYLKVVMLTKVGHVGLNVKGTSDVYLIDPPFTPDRLQQARDRNFRPNAHKYIKEWVDSVLEDENATEEDLKIAKRYEDNRGFPVRVYYCVAEVPSSLKKGKRSFDFDLNGDTYDIKKGKKNKSSSSSSLSSEEVIELSPKKNIKKYTSSSSSVSISEEDEENASGTLSTEEESDISSDSDEKPVKGKKKDFIKEEEKRLKKLMDFGDDLIFQDISKDEEDPESIDWHIYGTLKIKQDRINTIMTVFERISVDNVINTGRNNKNKARPRDILGPYNFKKNQPIDYTTYNAYYSLREASLVQNNLSKILQEKGLEVFDGATLMGLFPNNTSAEIYSSIQRIVQDRLPVGVDRFGFTRYLEEDSNVFYLTRNHSQQPDKALKNYSDNIIVNEQLYIESIVPEYLNEKTLESYKKELKKIKTFNSYLADLSNVYKAKLLEIALVSKNKEEWMAKVLGSFKYFYIKTDDFIIHSIYNIYETGSNYNPVDSLLQPKKKLMIYIDKVWRLCTKQEIREYSQMFFDRYNKELGPMYKKFYDIGIIGIIVSPDTIHIRRIKKKNDVYLGKGGIKGSGIPIVQLLHYMFQANVESDAPNQKIKQKKRDLLVESITEKVPGTSIDRLKDMSDEEVQYIEYELSQKSKVSFEKRLAKTLDKKGAIFCMLSDSESVIAKMK